MVNNRMMTRVVRSGTFALFAKNKSNKSFVPYVSVFTSEQRHKVNVQFIHLLCE